ncbi:MAG: transcription-repair coupling factor [Phycisphaerae bacterium]
MVICATMSKDERVRALCSRLGAGGSPLAANGLWGSCASILAGLIARDLGRPMLYITAHLEQADRARDDIETALGRSVDLLPAWETLPGEGAGDSEIGAERARLCDALRTTAVPGRNPGATDDGTAGGGASPAGAAAQGTDRREPTDRLPQFIIAPIQALIQPVPSPASLDAHTLRLTVGQQRAPESITAWLVERGFERLDQVEQPGDFALRGGVLDIFATADADPVRLEFFGDEIESIRQFEVGTQRSTRDLKETRVTACPDAARAMPSETTTFLSYLPPNALVVLHESVDIAEIAKTVLDRLGHPIGHFSFESILKRLGAFRQLHLSRFPLASVTEADSFRLSCEALPSFDAKASDAVQQLVELARHQRVVVYCDNQGERDRLAELIDQAPPGRADAGTEPTGRIDTRIGLIHEGFRWRGTADKSKGSPAADRRGAAPDAEVRHGADLVVVPHHAIFHRYAQRRRFRKAPSTRPIESFLDLDVGDFVVHIVHGIAKYVGMKTMRKGDSGKSEEFLTLKFADDATMHVPVSQIDLVQKYVGAKAMRPALSKVGATRWQTTKQKVEEAVSDLASDLLRVQAARESQPGIAYPHDTPWQAEFESAFPYPETPDQTTTLRDIKHDQVRARPMDRLLCGDVGYGKTELAVRAAFKVAEFGKQVAVLVPTTVLAEQHYRTFSERLADFPFVVERLNRFRSPSRQREIIRATKKGQIDVLIGTHRLLSRDVGFADLGLVIVDEEQRFGVEHKERLKRLRATVDVLTLTATPIPRTLHMAMVGMRDISSLATPPMDRRSIVTHVCPWNDETIREALVRELNREGQVFFVHNRVQSIRGVADRIAALVPDARIVVGHGQMSGEALEDVMLRFIRHEADILVCTTIIEAGLDIPNANTIFINRADRFGLADLHQLRGRVGRYKHRAYCYLLLSPDRPLTPTAARRLKAIEEFSELGAGFRIAMRDLEIRGAGNILGPEQSGNIAAVGYELYCQLLEKSVKRMRGEPFQERVAVHLELDVEAYIPKAYIASDRQRMECYRRVAACRTPRDVEQLAADLADAFGPYPETVDTLITLTDIRVRAAGFGVKSIIKRAPDVIFHFDGDVRALDPLFAGATGEISLPDDHTLYWRLPDHYFYEKTLLVILRNLFRRGLPGGEAGSAPKATRDRSPAAGRRGDPISGPPQPGRNAACANGDAAISARGEGGSGLPRTGESS